MKGLFSIGYYFNNDYDNYYSEISKYYLYGDKIFTSEAAIAINAIRLLNSSITDSGQYNKETILQYIYSQSLSTPSIYSMEFSGYARMSSKIYQLSSSNVFQLVYSPEFTSSPDIYYPTNRVCSWKDCIIYINLFLLLHR